MKGVDPGWIFVIGGLIFTIFCKPLGSKIADYSEMKYGYSRRDRLNQIMCALAGIGFIIGGILEIVD